MGNGAQGRDRTTDTAIFSRGAIAVTQGLSIPDLGKTGRICPVDGKRPPSAHDPNPPRRSRRRTAPFRLLKTHDGDTTRLYGRPFKCRSYGSREVTLFLIYDQAELDEIRRALAEPPRPTQAPTTHPRHAPDADLP